MDGSHDQSGECNDFSTGNFISAPFSDGSCYATTQPYDGQIGLNTTYPLHQGGSFTETIETDWPTRPQWSLQTPTPQTGLTPQTFQPAQPSQIPQMPMIYPDATEADVTQIYLAAQTSQAHQEQQKNQVTNAAVASLLPQVPQTQTLQTTEPRSRPMATHDTGYKSNSTSAYGFSTRSKFSTHTSFESSARSHKHRLLSQGVCLGKERKRREPKVQRNAKKPSSSSQLPPHMKKGVRMLEVWLEEFGGTCPDEKKLKGLADCINWPPATVRMWLDKANVQQRRAPSPMTQDLRVPTDEDILNSAKQWAEEQRNTICDLKGSLEGPYECTRKCGFKTRRRDVWERHEANRYVPEVFCCVYCRKEKGIKGLEFYARSDKIKKHFNDIHPPKHGQDLKFSWQKFIEESRIEIQALSRYRCGFCKGDSPTWKQWKDRCSHVARHFRKEIPGGPWTIDRWNNFWADEEDVNKSDSDDVSDQDTSDESGDRDDSDGDSDGDNQGSGGHNGNSNDSDGFEGNGDQLPGPDFGQDGWYDDQFQGFNDTAFSHGTRRFRYPLRFNRCKSTTSPSHLLAAESGKSLSLRRAGRVGDGSHSVVEKVVNEETKSVYALKTFRRTVRKVCMVQRFTKEVDILRRMKHPHVVEFVGHYEENNALHILMKPLADTDLENYMRKPGAFPSCNSHLGDWFGCLASGLSYLHSRSIRHKDLKPSNILLKDARVFIADFGISSDFSFDSTSVSSSIASMTPMYCAPEIANKEEHGTKADIFSLGCVFVELTTFMIQKTVDQLHTFLGLVENSQSPAPYYEKLFDVISWINSLRDRQMRGTENILETCKKMLRRNPSERPSAKDVVARMSSQDEIRHECDCCCKQRDIGRLKPDLRAGDISTPSTPSTPLTPPTATQPENIARPTYAEVLAEPNQKSSLRSQTTSFPGGQGHASVLKASQGKMSAPSKVESTRQRKPKFAGTKGRPDKVMNDMHGDLATRKRRAGRAGLGTATTTHTLEKSWWRHRSSSLSGQAASVKQYRRGLRPNTGPKKLQNHPSQSENHNSGKAIRLGQLLIPRKPPITPESPKQATNDVSDNRSQLSGRVVRKLGVRRPKKRRRLVARRDFVLLGVGLGTDRQHELPDNSYADPASFSETVDNIEADTNLEQIIYSEGTRKGQGSSAPREDNNASFRLQMGIPPGCQFMPAESIESQKDIFRNIKWKSSGDRMTSRSRSSAQVSHTHY